MRNRLVMLGRSAGPGLAVATGSIFGVGLNLVLPFALPAPEYALYSLLLGLAQVVTSLGFEWMRLALLRHGYGADAARAASCRATLAWAYLATIGTLFGLAGLALALSPWVDWALAGAVVLGCAAIQGAFDGQMAAARARFDDRAFTLRWVLRALLGLVLALAAGTLFRSGLWALFGLALSYPLAALLWLERLPRGRVDRAVLADLFRQGELAAIGGTLSTMVPAVTRTLMVASLGLAGASGILLAVDLGQRLFSIIGMAINVVAVQAAIRAVEQGRAVAARVRDVVVLPMAVIGPVAILCLVLEPQIAALLVPPDYRAGFAVGAWAVLLAAGLQAIRHYGLDPLFLILGRPSGAPLAPGLVLALLLGAGLVPAGWGSVEIVVLALLLANVAGVVAAVVALRALVAVPWPIGTLGRLGLALGGMGGVAALLPRDGGLWQGVASVLVLMLVYGAAVVLLDIGGLRRWLGREAVAG